MSEDEQTPFGRWYAKNKEALAQKRKERYRTDPEYRKKALARKKAQTARTPKMRDLLHEKYVYNLNGLAEELDVTIWRLREWREKSYFPEPHKHGRELWFTEQQKNLLAPLVKFFSETGGRVPGDKQESLEVLTSWITANW